MNTFIIGSDLSTSNAEGRINIGHMAVQLIVGLDQAVDVCYDTVMSFFSYRESCPPLTVAGTGGNTQLKTMEDKEDLPVDNQKVNEGLHENVDAKVAHSDIHSVWNSNFMF